MIEEIRKLVNDNLVRSEIARGVAEGEYAPIEVSFYSGAVFAYKNVMKILDRFLDEKGVN